MLGWFKKLIVPYEGSNDKFIGVVRDIREGLENVTTLDNLKILNAQTSLLGAYMTTRGDVRIIDEIRAELDYQLMKFEIRKELKKDSHD